MELELKIEGLEQLNETLKAMVKALDPDTVEKVLMDGAKLIRDDAKRRAPKGPTGNLKKAIRAKKLRRLGFGNQPATVIVAVDRKKAPHAAWVEYGIPHPRKVDPKKNIFGVSSVGPMPAKPYFRPAVDATAPVALRQIAAELTKLVEGAAK